MPTNGWKSNDAVLAEVVERAMDPGKAMNDEQIYHAVARIHRQMTTTPDRVRHARKYLSDSGRISRYPVKGRTTRGASCNLWVRGAAA